MGVPTVTDILTELDKPGRDPRPEFTTATFKEGVNKITDLAPGMILEGTVTNVTAFGAFVDVGVHQDGLVHVSALANRFVADPHDVVRSGQMVKVKVMEVDVERKRIGLSMRLDDEPGAGRQSGAKNHSGTKTGGRPKAGHSDDRSRNRRSNGRGKRAVKGGSGGAMAEALKRAGF